MACISFDTGGWRAVIGGEFARSNVKLLCGAFAQRIKKEGNQGQGVVIGYGRRFLSGVAAKWAAEVFAGEGVAYWVIRIARAPTPLIIWTVRNPGLSYGMAVTASRSPALYNGIKMFTAGDRDASEVVTRGIEDRITRLEDTREARVGQVPYDKTAARGLIRQINLFNGYTDSVIDQVGMDAIRRIDLKIALDPIFRASRTSLQTILMTARCEVGIIHDHHDTLFGGRMPSPNSASLDSLKRYVVDNGYALGITTDGDADRLGVIDDKGNFLHPNQLLVILYYYFLKYEGWRGPAVRNVATASLLDEVAHQFGQKCHEVPVGFRWASGKMLRTDAIIGGESSGGLAVRGHISDKDGIYAATLLMEMLIVVGKPMSEICEEITEQLVPRCMAETNFTFDSERKQEISRILMEDRLLPEFLENVRGISYRDGYKVYFEDGWIIARFSGTEPLLRIFCKMPTRERTERTCEGFRKFLGLQAAVSTVHNDRCYNCVVQTSTSLG